MKRKMSEITILVKSAYGSQTLHACLCDKIIDLKKKIQEKYDFKVHKQVLYFRGIILEDDKTADEYRVKENDVLLLHLRRRDGLRVFAITMDDKEISLDVFDDETIYGVKKQIQEKLNILPQNQKLIYKSIELQDDKFVASYDFDGCCKIFIIERLRDNVCVSVIMNAKETLSLQLAREDEVSIIYEELSITHKVEKLLFNGVELKYNKTIAYYTTDDKITVDVVLRLDTTLFVETKNGERYTVKVTKSDKILDVKRKIEKDVNIEPQRQRLMFGDRILENDETIENCQLFENSVILVLDEVKIEIKLIVETIEGQRLQLNVTRNESILWIKNNIGPTLQLPPKRLRLLHNNVHLRNGNTIDDYDLHEGSVVTVFDKLKLAVPVCARTEDGSQYPFTVTRSDDIKDIKLKIQGILNLDSNRQKLSHNKVTMKDGFTISKYSLPKNGIIDVHDEFVVIRVSIQEFNGTRSELEVNKMDSILFLKEKISEKGILQANEQELIYDGKKLINENLLKDFEIEDGCVIHTIPVWQTVAVIVRLPSTKTVVLEPKIVKTVKQFKRNIEKRIGHEGGSMDIIFNDSNLSDEDFVWMCGFFHKCEVAVAF